MNFNPWSDIADFDANEWSQTVTVSQQLPLDRFVIVHIPTRWLWQKDSNNCTALSRIYK